MAPLLANVKASLAAMPSSHSVVASSPSSRRIAETKSWNEAFDGATPMRPVHSSPVRSRTLAGSSSSGTISRVEGEHPLAPGEADPAAVAGMELLGDELEDVVGERAEQAVLVEVADRAGRLREEDVGRRLVALLLDQQGEVGRVAVAHLDVDAGLLGEAVEDRLDEVLGAPGVDDDGAAVVAGTAPGSTRPSSAAAESDAPQQGSRRHDRHGRPSDRRRFKAPYES